MLYLQCGCKEPNISKRTFQGSQPIISWVDLLRTKNEGLTAHICRIHPHFVNLLCRVNKSHYASDLMGRQHNVKVSLAMYVRLLIDNPELSCEQVHCSIPFVVTGKCRDMITVR